MTQSSLLKAGIVGVTGYGGGELARLLLAHPLVELTYVTSNSSAGKKLSSSFAGMSKRTELVCEPFDAAKASANCDVVFLAGEAGLAMKVAPQLLAAGRKIIDLSADFRLQDVAAFEAWYKMPHGAQDLLPSAIYGLPELFREKIKDASFIANPGCYVTGAILALAPLLQSGLVDPQSLIIDSASGVSGAGRSKFGPDTHFAEVNESMRPYGAGGAHRHVPEMEQILGQVVGEKLTLTFTPHLAPITRGILTTAYANLKDKGAMPSFGDLQALYEKAYAAEPFVTVLPEGAYPATKHVAGSNACHISLALDKRTGRVIVFSVIDNLIKGMTGQAIQNMNLMCGFPETTGLDFAGLWP